MTIVFLIMCNTLILAMDSYPVNLHKEFIVEIMNYIFFGIFFLEMLLKIGGLGIKMYL
jgi:hypothetical protein